MPESNTSGNGFFNNGILGMLPKTAEGRALAAILAIVTGGFAWAQAAPREIVLDEGQFSSLRAAVAKEVAREVASTVRENGQRIAAVETETATNARAIAAARSELREHATRPHDGAATLDDIIALRTAIQRASAEREQNAASARDLQAAVEALTGELRKRDGG